MGNRREDLDYYLELRRKMKEKKPEFLRHLWWKKAKFKNEPKWRKPKGIDNKMRLQLKGYPPIVKVGYRGPVVVRGLHPQGLIPVVVNTALELEKYDPGKHIVYIGGGVGLKKAIEIYKAAVSQGFRVANPPRVTS
ncbi:MAG: 50S ribosomal protein L32e [Thermosphaera sp.]|nr:50S ribosomal protein L32e [Thermosphaera sp.]